MNKIRSGIRENAKYLDGKRDLTVTRKRDSPKFGHGVRDFFARLSEIREVVRSSGKCEVEQASVLLAMEKSDVGNDYIIETIK